MDSTKASAESASSAREMFQRTGKEPKAERPKAERKRPAASARVSPTRSIEPGVFHYRAAEALLTLIQRQAAAKGIDLDMGDSVVLDGLPEVEDDPQRLARLTAHAIARVADRFPLARRFSRHMEGRERRAGILSDIGAALVCLYHRNPPAVEQLVLTFKDEVRNAHAARTSAKQQGPTTNGAGNPDHITPQEGIINA